MKKLNAVLVLIGLGLMGLLVCIMAFSLHQRTALLANPPEHGTSFVLEFDAADVQRDPNGLANLQRVVKKRLAKIGLRLFWEPISPTRVRVVAPIADPRQNELVRVYLARGGRLEFRLVHEKSAELLKQGSGEAGYDALTRKEQRPDGSLASDTLLIKKHAEMTGQHITSASVTRGAAGRPEIAFAFDPEGAAAFGKLTRENVGRQLAIVLDGQLMTAPTILDPIEGGSGQITGNFTEKEAFGLANALESPLPFPITVQVEKRF